MTDTENHVNDLARYFLMSADQPKRAMIRLTADTEQPTKKTYWFAFFFAVLLDCSGNCLFSQI